MADEFSFEEAAHPVAGAPKAFSFEEASAPKRTAPSAHFPQDDPKLEYGSVLPLAKNRETGAVSLAVPEIIRSPARGLVDINDRLRGPLTPEKMRGLNPDEQGLVMAAGGLRVAPGMATAAAKAAARPMAMTARDAGYVLPPASASDNPGLVSRILAGWSGKIKTQQAASSKNQEVTNELATAALGLPKGTVLTDEALRGVRQQAGKSYQAVIGAVRSVQPDSAFKDVVSGLGGQNSQAAKYFPKITNNPGIKEMVDELKSAEEAPTEAWVELVKELRFNSTRNLKSIGDPSAHALGLAQREAANAVDDLIERSIEKATGEETGLVDAYRAARKLIAKSYDVEGATNTATGDVNARGLARLQDRGRPLSDELKTIADVASAFPKAMQAPAGFGDNEAWSGLDFFGSAAAMAHGNPGVVAAIMGRPVARAAMLSHPYQNTITGSPTFGGGPRVAPDSPSVLRPFNPGLLGTAQDRLQGATNGVPPQ